MKFRDALRAQLYLKHVIACKERVEKVLNKIKEDISSLKIKNIEKVVKSVALHLADGLDEIILPTIAYEVGESHKRGELEGSTPEKRYDSFFLDSGDDFSDRFKDLPQKYPLLFELIRLFSETFIDNVCKCLNRLHSDFVEVKSEFLTKSSEKLVNIEIPSSDRHRGGQTAVILVFGAGKKLVYKPVDLHPDQLFSQFLEKLNLPNEISLRTPDIIRKEDYGWLEFIPNKGCDQETEIRTYYKRFGSLVAVADFLNYTDGHFDNLIAYGSTPVLIDGETLFHNFYSIDKIDSERSILYTGLVQKPPKPNSNRGFNSALQAVDNERYHCLKPYAIHDRTDEIKVRFQGITEGASKNSPKLAGEIAEVKPYVSEVIEGFQTAYDCIISKSEEVLQWKSWWSKVSSVKVRQLIRHTMFYQLLIRKIQQPPVCGTEDKANQMLSSYLEKEEFSQFSEYEQEVLLRLNIPYFYHKPGERDLYDDKDEKYPKFLSERSINQIQSNFRYRGEEYKKRQIGILKNVLPNTSNG